MPVPLKLGLEAARSQLPTLVSRAEAGQSSVITRHGRPCAAIVPVHGLPASARRGSLLALRGSGTGLWRTDAAAEVAWLRDEWV